MRGILVLERGSTIDFLGWQAPETECISGVSVTDIYVHNKMDSDVLFVNDKK